MLTKNLCNFIGRSQQHALRSACAGEEREFFKQMLKDLDAHISAMPATYETDGQGNAALVQLHYFYGGSDWYITEKDSNPDGEGQLQAFGFACINGDYFNAEMGYISIMELIENDVELDLYFKPCPIGEIKEKFKAAA